MPVVVGSLRAPLGQREELVAHADERHSRDARLELDVEDAAVELERLVEVADLEGDMVDSYEPRRAAISLSCPVPSLLQRSGEVLPRRIRPARVPSRRRDDRRRGPAPGRDREGEGRAMRPQSRRGEAAGRTGRGPASETSSRCGPRRRSVERACRRVGRVLHGQRRSCTSPPTSAARSSWPAASRAFTRPAATEPASSIAVIDVGFRRVRGQRSTAETCPPVPWSNRFAARATAPHMGRRSRSSSTTWRPPLSSTSLHRQRAQPPAGRELRDQPAHPDHQPLHHVAGRRPR